MTVVPHKSDDTEAPEIAPRQSVKTFASSAIARTKDAWAKASTLKRDAANSKLADRIAALADKTAKETKAATGTAVAAGKIGLARAAEIGRETVLPELERTGAKLKERARPDRLKQDYRRYLHLLHGRVFDARIEPLFFAPTKDAVALTGLHIKGPQASHGHDYRPSPCALFEWSLAAIDYDLSRLTFVDYGAGKGRVLLLASEHPFAAVAGVEFAEELHDDAVMNIRQYPRSRMKCREVEVMLDDAAAVGPPDGETVFYFFNPFSREMFAEVLSGIIFSYRRKPRRLYLILIDPVATDLVEESGVFQRIELPPAERIKARLLSPYEIAVYRSLA
jgi:hypothetical protein